MRRRDEKAVWRVLALVLAISFIIAGCSGILDNDSVSGFSGPEIGSVIDIGTRANFTNTTIFVNGYVFDCMLGEPSLPPDLVAPAPKSGVIGVYIVNCVGPILQEWVDALRALNIEIVAPLHYYAYQVRITPEQAQLAKNLSFVNWVGFYHPAYKIASNLDGHEVQVVLYDQNIPNTTIQQVHSKFSSIKQEGATTSLNFTEDGYVFEGTLSSSVAISEIAANPYVQAISPLSDAHLFDDNKDEINFILFSILVITITLILNLIISVYMLNKTFRKKQDKDKIIEDLNRLEGEKK